MGCGLWAVGCGQDKEKTEKKDGEEAKDGEADATKPEEEEKKVEEKKKPVGRYTGKKDYGRKDKEKVRTHETTPTRGPLSLPPDHLICSPQYPPPPHAALPGSIMTPNLCPSLWVELQHHESQLCPPPPPPPPPPRAQTLPAPSRPQAKEKSTLEAVADMGAIPPLVELLKGGCGPDAQKEAAVALWALADHESNRRAITAANGVSPLVDLLDSPNGEWAKERANVVFGGGRSECCFGEGRGRAPVSSEFFFLGGRGATQCWPACRWAPVAALCLCLLCHGLAYSRPCADGRTLALMATPLR